MERFECAGARFQPMGGSASRVPQSRPAYWCVRGAKISAVILFGDPTARGNLARYSLARHSLGRSGRGKAVELGAPAQSKPAGFRDRWTTLFFCLCLCFLHLLGAKPSATAARRRESHCGRASERVWSELAEDRDRRATSATVVLTFARPACPPWKCAAAAARLLSPAKNQQASPSSCLAPWRRRRPEKSADFIDQHQLPLQRRFPSPETYGLNLAASFCRAAGQQRAGCKSALFALSSPCDNPLFSSLSLLVSLKTLFRACVTRPREDVATRACALWGPKKMRASMQIARINIGNLFWARRSAADAQEAWPWL